MNNKISVVIFKNDTDEFDQSKLCLDWSATYCELGFETYMFNVNMTSDITKLLSECGNYDIILLYNGVKINFSLIPIYENNKILFGNNKQSLSVIAQNIVLLFYKENQNYYKNCIEGKMFSIITPTYNTPTNFLERAYNSLCKQTYNNWEWFILDDSTNTKVIEYLQSLKDSRIRIISNITNKGNVGYNKHILGMSSRGQYILELDHDDELTDDCLKTLLEAFKAYPEAGFAYSNCLELLKSGEVDYGDNWARGQGGKYIECINGKNHLIMDSPDINCVSIRSIISCPNHVRCWKKTVYVSIFGHNNNFSVMDDFELLIRTFIITKFIKIKKTLYIQHREHETTQNTRNKEIQRMDYIIRLMYDRRIHERILELGNENSDICWDSVNETSLLNNYYGKIKEIYNFKF